MFTIKRVALLAVAAVLVGCHENASKSKGPTAMSGTGAAPPEVSFVEVTRESVTLTTELPGRLEPFRVAEVRARVPGIIIRRLFDEGTDVKAGEVLFQIDPAPLQAALSSAKAIVAKAQANHQQADAKAKRFSNLIKSNAVSKQDYEDALAEAQQAEAELIAASAGVETASLNLGYASVTAPITGRIGRAKVTEGALVGQNEATPLATIQQFDSIYFDFTQSTTELLKLKKALEAGKLKSIATGEAKVTLMLDDGSTYPEPGKLLFRDVTVDPTTGMVTLRALFTNRDHLLLPNMFARGRLEQAIENEALTVPQRAVTRGPNGSATVMVINDENKVESREVQTEAAHEDKWVVTGNIKPGERVIVEGHLKAPPGSVVVPVSFSAHEQPLAAMGSH